MKKILHIEGVLVAVILAILSFPFILLIAPIGFIVEILMIVREAINNDVSFFKGTVVFLFITWFRWLKKIVESFNEENLMK